MASAVSRLGSKSPKNLAPENYFVIPTKILIFTGLYPVVKSNHSLATRLIFSLYTWSVFLIFSVLNPVTKAIALPSTTNLDDLTDDVSFLTNHVMAVLKIAVFLAKREDLIRLVEAIHSPKFQHTDCGGEFSANDLIRRAVRTTKYTYCVFATFVMGLIFGSIISAVFDVSEENSLDFNRTAEGLEEIDAQRYRALPFHSWYPFSTQSSPAYEMTFFYQIIALFITAQIVMALDTLVVGFMIHIKAQFTILSHNLRYLKSHAINRQRNSSISNQRLNHTIESDLEIHVAHHQAIIRLTQDLESVFSGQLLMQFICSIFAVCTLLWQISSTPVKSAKFASMVSYFGATIFQLFIYCWFGNEMMLESLSVAEAAWDSKWHETISRRFSYGVGMIITRAQRVTTITAGGVADLSLETFVKVCRAAYSVFAVLKKRDD